MKKILLSGFVVLTFLLYSYHERTEDDEVRIITPPTQPTNSQNSMQKMMQENMTTKYKDGTYTGNVTDAFYGNFQVQAAIQNGKIVDINFLQFPNDRGTSITINNQSNPILKQEAIQKQSANVDIVSGATQSSEAFVKSLQSALDKASI